MKKVVIGIIVAIIVVAVIIVGVVVYRRSRIEKLIEERGINTQIETEEMVTTLIANVETNEEAEEIAELYGIILISFEDKVAIYETEKDPQELIRMGEEKGYPAIGINNSFTIN
ncbi:MAG: hypothetical protein ACI4DN_00125 [Lachnospiraceae bacterium]